MTLFADGDRVLFQGDSITDCGRSRDDDDELGGGYASHAARRFALLHPGLDVTFLNRGISGNRVVDLEGRWDVDCLDLKPTWLSILIGINDVWRRYDSNDPTSCEDYAAGYRRILQRAADAGIKLIICEPFVLPVPEDRKTWREDLDPKIHAARELAVAFGAIYVPFDGLFAAAVTRAPAAIWAGDGVHPTQSGHALMADTWLRTVGAM